LVNQERKNNMIKNKTLRGLAISAVVALGVSGFASAPASANYGLADKTFVTVAPATGDEFTVLADSSFTVEANKAALTGELSLLVEDSGLVATHSAGVARAANNSFVLGNAAADSSTSASSEWLLTQNDTNRNAFSASKTIQVTAWNDANNNGKIDATEYASTTQTITFLDADDVKLNVSLNRPFVGETTLSALVSTTPTLNDEQISTTASFSDYAELVFQKSGIATTASAAAADFVWDEDDRNYTVTSPAFDTWGFVSMSDEVNASVSREVLTSVRVTTGAAHNAVVGDGFTFSSSAQTGRATVSSIVSTTVFIASTATNSPAATWSATATATPVNATLSGVVNAVAKATAGTYIAVGNWNGVKVATSEFATSAVVADSVEVNIAGSANTDAVVDSSSATARVKTGTLTVDVIATVLDEDGDAVGAGVVVQIKNNFTSGKDIRVNGKTGTDTVLTDANGQVKATVTSVAGATGLSSQLTFDAEGAATATATLTWTAQAFSMVDLSVANGTFGNQTRSILKGGSYALDLAVVDQWYTAPADSSIFRVTVTGAGATNGIVNLTGGKAAVTIGDNGLATSYATTITLQRQNASGTWAAVGASAVVTTEVATGAVTLGANATSLFGATVVLASDVAAKALVEGDIRVAPLAVPAYANNAVVAGAVRNATTGVAVNGAVVTITGPTSLLFSNGVAYKRGSITVLADSNGHFNVNVYSTTAGKDIVVTAAAMGNSSTTKLTFTGVGVGEGTSLVITAPDTVEPASTLQVKAKLTDAFGNPVTAAAGRMKVTYTGPGIIFGTLPTATDTAGELMFSALLGAADKGTITVVVSYDQNGDGDYVDAKDLNTTKVITVGAAAPAAPATDQKLTVGSFKGFVAIYALNYTGQKLSAKVAGKWLTVNNLSRFQRVVRNTGAAIPIVVDLYIDGKFVRTENIVTK
jgi:hypothetical protein